MSLQFLFSVVALGGFWLYSDDDGRREVILFLLEEETEARRFSIYRLAQTDRVVPIVVFLDRGRHPYELHL